MVGKITMEVSKMKGKRFDPEFKKDIVCGIPHSIDRQNQKFSPCITG